MADFERVIGKKPGPLDPAWLAEQSGSYDRTHLDVGTGSGEFIFDLAGETPDLLAIGLDPVSENMATISRKASASAKKGGTPNALFVRGAAEALPGPFAALADEISINYPWGSLMRIIAKPDIEQLRKIIACGKPGTKLSIYLNYDVLKNRDYLDRMGFEDLIDPLDNPDFDSDCQQAGLAPVTHRVMAGDPPFRSKWGRQLIRGSGRQTLIVESHILP